MICYAIKNDDQFYYNSRYEMMTRSLYLATLFPLAERAQMEIDKGLYCSNDEWKVVKIEIKEVEE